MFNSLKAKKSLGQNFLKDDAVIKDIIVAGEVSSEDTVIEIGPGKGSLTKHLLEKAGKLIAIELDKDLIPWLKMDFGKNKHFELIHGDALRYEPEVKNYKVIANIPYYITSPLLNHFLREQFQRGNPPKRLVIMMQKEVAEKIMAEKGRHSVLSLEVACFATVKWVREVSRKCFTPMPKVESAILQIDTLDTPAIQGNLKKIFWLFHQSFRQPRKKLSNNLSAALHCNAESIRTHLKAANIHIDTRAESLTLNDWQNLLNELDSKLPAFEA